MTAKKTPLPAKPDIPPSPPSRLKKLMTHRHSPASEPETPSTTNYPRLLKVILILLLLLASLIVPPLTIVSWYLSSFSQASGTTTHQLYSQVRSGLNSSILQTDNYTNFLFLGLDEIVGQKDNSLLTDTIIVAFFNHQDQTLTLLPLPRDLWIDALKTKINAIYYYGEISDQTSGRDFTSTVVSQVIGQPIHYTTIINLQILENLINSLDGVTLDIPQTFTDDHFPRSDVDVTTPTDPAQLYETITFEAGTHHLDGLTALKYIRSRYSQDASEGTDLARSTRQLNLVQAIISTIATPQALRNPHVMGNIYGIYRELDTNFTTPELVAFIKQNYHTVPQLKTISLPIKQDQTLGLITNPPISKYDQWVYEPVDPTWSQIHFFVQNSLGLNP